MADGTPREKRAASARGLFRATGHRTAQMRLDGDYAGEAADVPREAADFYPTPPEPVRAFLAAEGARLSEFPAIWEPAAGDGAMAREIAAAGYAVETSDIVPRGGFRPDVTADFFALRRPMAPAIVTNPPYHLVNWRDGKVWDSAWQGETVLRMLDRRSDARQGDLTFGNEVGRFAADA